jgi:hypothetical protein
MFWERRESIANANAPRPALQRVYCLGDRPGQQIEVVKRGQGLRGWEMVESKSLYQLSYFLSCR